ncbi:DMT family transporter [Alphaproteobacteria bacterium]|jgi:drug/metabolite transporter (DMT)-like permease|nr:DMT family transporter [Alphaproteobacteria bacterium]|tara:strand:+ start:1744 stop:2634 length:891 start_codon:yes stop_codon:yes gene_type:complete
MNLTNKQKGLGLSLIGVLLITPDSLFLRLIDLDAWELVFYRGLVPFICLLILLSFYYRSQFIKSFLVLGIPGLIYAILIALGSTTFVISIENTYVANTLIMIALLPFATAILSSIFLKEHPSKRMWLTIIACFAVVLFIFYDSYQGNRLYGDFFGLLTAIMVGGSAVVVRYGKNFNFLPALLLSKFFIMLIAIIFMQNFPETLFVDQKNLYLIIAMGVFAVFIPLAMITLAPRYIPAYEVEIFFVLETILGPVWVWLVIHEQPTNKTIIGGVFIIIIILIHTILELRDNKKAQLNS